MTRGLDDLPAQLLPEEVEITEVQTGQDRAGWLDVLMEGFEEPEESRADFRQYLNHTLSGADHGWRHFLARWQGEPCAISTLLCAQLAAGIYHVTTLPAYRSRGLGRALTLAAMYCADEIGYSSAVLFATPAGYPLYRELGFQTVMTADFYASNGRASE
jgi:GNAT superfamily N-acetyltransferase